MWWAISAPAGLFGGEGDVSGVMLRMGAPEDRRRQYDAVSLLSQHRVEGRGAGEDERTRPGSRVAAC